MLRSLEAVIEEDGTVRLKEKLHLKGVHRAIVTVLDDPEHRLEQIETAYLSEPALARDWQRSEEDEAWSHLQSAQ
jgi:hypothetical protein